jgi:hypothetical protein
LFWLSRLELGVEGRGDSAASVTGRRLVITRRGKLPDRLDPERQLRAVVVVEEAMAGRGIQLDVVVDSRRL